MVNEQKTGIVITARVGSKRLPNKALLTVGGTESIRLLIRNTKNAKYPIVLAIPKTKENDCLVDIAKEEGIYCYRGEDDSPLERICEVGEIYEYDNVVRITHDDILQDGLILRKMIKFHENGNNDYVYCARIIRGTDSEVIRVKALRDIVDTGKLKGKESICYYIRNGNYRVKEFYPPYEYQYPYRLTMDYPEDLTLLRIIHSAIVNPSTLDVINYLKREKYLLQINHIEAVTVFIPCYNNSKYVIEAAESVLAQTEQDFKLIIIDDCSTDNSCSVIAEWYSSLNSAQIKKVGCFRNRENLGLTGTSNKAISMSRSRYIMRLDADDKLADNALEKMLGAIGDNGAIISGFFNMEDNGAITGEVLENEYHPACALINRQCACTIRYRHDLKYFDGLDFWKRFLKEYSVGFLSEALWYYRQHETQKTATDIKVRDEAKKGIFNAD